MCFSIVHLEFASPSHLRELLDLPPKLRGFLAIPDSVEILAFSRRLTFLEFLTLTFGSDSKVTEIRERFPTESAPGRLFMHVSSRSLKRFRAKLEFNMGV
jgi:hypothetical protein